MKKLDEKKIKAALKDYAIGVAAAAIALAIGAAVDFAPQYSILIAGLTAPLAAWADKNRKEYGLKK